MKGRDVYWLLFAALLLVPAYAVAADGMKPGLWEITTKVDMPGMPFQPPPTTVKHCYTAEEVKESPVPKDNNCKVTDLKTSGSKTTWKVECTGEAAGKGEGEITYQGDSAYEGKTRMQTQGMTMAMQYKAKRLGDCK
jgi:hypothetical protein